MLLRRLTRRLIKRAGYEIHPVMNRACLVRKDAFQDQRALLAGQEVSTIFDIGANNGQTTLKYRRLFPNATIYSFEPFAVPLHELRDAFSTDELVKPVELAVSDTAGTRKFFLNRSSYTNSLLPSVQKDDLYENIETLDVAVTTIDEFCVQESIGEIQILKMDIQGGELMALKGASRKLAEKSISLIYTEVLFARLYEDQATFFGICEFLADFGYQLFDLYEFAYEPSGQLAWGDAVFVRSH